MEVKGGWVLEVDIRNFFDTIDHKQLQEFVSRRVRNGVLRRLIGKWLNAGVMESGNVSYSDGRRVLRFDRSPCRKSLFSAKGASHLRIV